ncbi:MAG: tetratricopeptide repeat protein [Candidatus Latescibacteria bacterium]|jgi:tetratricopeptide (TPR) repeat protein|nr:tetratricopeptide repeat protein [Candidatus Latescibacterota bacterium]
MKFHKTRGPQWPSTLGSSYHYLFAILCLATACGNEADSTIVDLYRQGNEFYEREQYSEASRIYERMLQLGFEHGSVYYNLGNAYFKQKETGRAILAYERAARLRPRDRDTRTNLEIANLRTVDRIQIDEPWIGYRLLKSFTIDEATLGVSVPGLVLLLLCIGFVLAKSNATRRRIYRIGVLSAIVLALMGAVAGARFYDHFWAIEAIILDQESPARSGPGDNYDPLFSLHEGTKVTVIEQRSGWKRILLPDGKEGWISRESLSII